MESILGLAIDCTRSTVYISHYGGLQATTLTGTQKWFKPLTNCWGVAVHSSTGNVFVSQYDDNQVQVFTSAGASVRTIGSALKGASGRLGNFYGPTGLAVLGSALIVADADNNRFEVRRQWQAMSRAGSRNIMHASTSCYSCWCWRGCSKCWRR